MALIDRIRDCTQNEVERRVPLYVGDHIRGHLAPDLVTALRGLADVFEVGSDAVRFRADCQTPATRTAGVARVVAALSSQGFFSSRRGELYPVCTRWGEAPAFVVERAASGAFGTPAFGVHLNGWTEAPSGPLLWVARRALDKGSFPGRLDHLVAGGQPLGLGLRANLEKECLEEAGLAPPLTHGLSHIHALRYQLEDTYGFHDDTIHCFDLVLPRAFEPRPVDGEVASFERWPIKRVIDTLRETSAFKTNVALVVLDWLLRHGHLAADPEEAVLTTALESLRQPLIGTAT